MPSRRTKKKEFLNSTNAQSVANRGLNAAFTQANGQLVKDANGRWTQGDGYTTSARGRLSTNGRTAGGSTWTFSDKNRGRQSGRSQIASRRQRYYDVRVGLGMVGG